MDPNKIGSNPEQQPGTGTETGLTDTHKDEPKKRKGLKAMIAAVTGLFAIGSGIAGSAHNDVNANAKTGPHPTNEYAVPHPAGPQPDNPEGTIGTVDTSNNPGGQDIEDASGNGKPNIGYVPSRAEDVPSIPRFNDIPSIEVPSEMAPGTEIQSSSNEMSGKPSTSQEGGAGSNGLDANSVESSANPPADSYTIPVVPSSGEADPTTEPGPGASADPGGKTPER